MTQSYTYQKKGTPDEVDKHVGLQMRARRKALGLSLEYIADLTSVSYQQCQKYEQGKNRISAGRLFELAHILDVPVTYFYEGEIRKNSLIRKHIG